MRSAKHLYVQLWVVAAVASLTVLITVAPPPEPTSAMLVFFLLAIVTEKADLRLYRGDAAEGLTLIEATVAAVILLFPPVWALAIMIAAAGFAHLTNRMEPLKLVFNMAQYIVATAIAIGVYHGLRGGPLLGLRDLLAIAVAMAVFGLVNSAAVSGIVAILQRRPFRTVVLEDSWLAGVMVLGNTAVGVVAALLWQQRPWLILLLAVPAFTLHLAYQGVVRSRELLVEVSAERDRLDRIVVGASDGIVLIGAEGEVEVWSPAVQRMTGIPATEALGAPIAEVFSGRDESGGIVDGGTPLRTATVDDPVQIAEFRLPHRHGGDRVVLARHTVLFDERGRLTGDVVIVHDVTREREVEGMKDDFVARVSHELRTPLTPIKGYAQSLIRRPDMAEDLKRRAIEQIAERADHMARLIDDLLLVSRISAGRADLSHQVVPEAFDVVALCERALDNFRVTHPTREMTVEVTGPVPLAFADPVRVEQVVANLIGNACKYSEEGTPVTVTLERTGNGLAVSVRDEGRGIPPDHLERIFDRFHRVEDPMRMETGGIGLGLYIASELAKAMNGRIEVRSRLGIGSTFTLHLPADRTESATPSASVTA